MSFFEKVKSVSKAGTIRTSNIIDFTDDPQGRSHETHPGFYTWTGESWVGPAETIEEANTAFRKSAWNKSEEGETSEDDNDTSN